MKPPSLPPYACSEARSTYQSHARWAEGGVALVLDRVELHRAGGLIDPATHPGPARVPGEPHHLERLLVADQLAAGRPVGWPTGPFLSVSTRSSAKRLTVAGCG